VTASIIIAKRSFWIKKPLVESISEALDHFKKDGNVEKLKIRINNKSLPSDPQYLITFLYDLIKDF
jgi:hypothetical protein